MGKRILRLGVHTSIAGGLHLSLERARELGCNTMQIFSHNPRGWALPGRSPQETTRFRKLREKYSIAPIFIHTSYLINLASRNLELLKKSVDMLVEEMNIADSLGAEYVVLHTGSASGDDPASARKRAAAGLIAVSERGRWDAGLLLENTAGERGDITSGLEELSELLGKAGEGLISGICFDTCHAFAAGYDITSEEAIDSLVATIDKYIDPGKVKLIHLNDSKGGLGSHLDRHEHIGLGRIGLSGIEIFINHPFFAGIPLILETPKKTEDDDLRNLKTVKRLTNSRPAGIFRKISGS